MEFLGDLFKFMSSDEPGRLSITLNGEEINFLHREEKTPEELLKEAEELERRRAVYQAMEDLGPTQLHVNELPTL